MPLATRSEDDRTFFSLLRAAIFSNPFEGVRERVAQLTGVEPVDNDFHHYTALIPILEDKLRDLEHRGVSSLHHITTTDRPYLEHAYLFLVYERYNNEMNHLIQVQQLSSEPSPVEFADALLFDLETFGVTKKDALRYFALFYQLRRAYHFIHQGLIGNAPCMTQLRRSLWNNVFTHDVLVYGNHLWNRMEDFSTLILGETGTGKGTAAAAMGRSGLIPFDAKSGRFQSSFSDNFLATNLSQYPETLIESELFGHCKGAFTGAISHHKGLFARCSDNGSLFLDEIGDLSTANQIKLLKVLEERQFSPVGSHKMMRFAGRIIAATHQPVEQLLASGHFRQDFYFRLSSDVITVPSLRQRLNEDPAEMPLLLSLIVQRLTGTTNNKLVETALYAIKNQVPGNYHWPGNVRELEQVVRRIILNNHVGQLMPRNNQQPDWLVQAERGTLSADELLSTYCRTLYETHKSYVKVGEITGLDRRTVKKYLTKKP